MTGPVLGEAGHIKRDKNHYAVILVLPGRQRILSVSSRVLHASFSLRQTRDLHFQKSHRVSPAKRLLSPSVQVLRVVSFPSMFSAKQH
jgi:hypothetical protein